MDADVAGGRGSCEWAPRHLGCGSGRPPLPSPPLSSPARPSPCPPCPPCLLLLRLRARPPAAPAALRGPQAGVAAALSSPPPAPAPAPGPWTPPGRKTKLPRVTDEGSAHAPNDPSRGTTLSSSLRDDSILDHVTKFSADECRAASPQAWSLRE